MNRDRMWTHSKPDKHCMHKCGIKVHSCNNCCNGREINITYSEQVLHILLVALHIQNAMHMHHIIICSMSGYTVFFHDISQMAWLLKKLLNIKCVLWFSLQLLPETLFILRKTEWDEWSWMCIGLHVKYPYSCQILMKL